MKFISWNVNGFRAVMKKNFMEIFTELDADFFCLQETKMQAGQLEVDLPGYEQYYNYATKKGYSGTAIFTKHHPLSVSYGIREEIHDQEGRVITLEYPEFFLVTCYTPNSQNELKRLSYRLLFEESFNQYLNTLKETKPVIVCGDLNVAHENIDLKNWKTNQHNAGFTKEERDAFQGLLSTGFIDSFRFLHPEEIKYSWWSYRFNARKNNAGWRIDYFLTSENIKEHITKADILTDIYGSDHCPVLLELTI